MTKHYDVPNVVQAFLDKRYENRAELVTELGAEVRAQNKPVLLLVAQVAHESLTQPGCTPEMTVRIGIMYGMVIGVLLERDRLERERSLGYV